MNEKYKLFQDGEIVFACDEYQEAVQVMNVLAKQLTNSHTLILADSVFITDVCHGKIKKENYETSKAVRKIVLANIG